MAKAAWSMAVPWTGFPVSALIKEVCPKPKAKLMRMVTAYRAEEMPGTRNQRNDPIPGHTAKPRGWTRHERTSLLVTGIYGKPLPKQNGAPIRFLTPWKYSLKSIKSIVKIEFMVERPRDLESGAATRVRLVLERQPRQTTRALVPGTGRGSSGHKAAPNADAQWLRKACSEPVQG